MIDPRYDTTRDAWRDVWTRTDVTREWETRDYARSQAIRDRWTPYLPLDAHVLEAGCGLGAELLGLVDTHDVIGIDYVLPPLRALKAHRGDLRVSAADVHALPFRDGTFGAYLSFGVLEHFTFGPLPALREAARVLRPHGVLVVTVPAPSVIWRLVRLKHRLVPPQDDGAPRYYETAYTARALREAVTTAGFTIQECHPVGHDFVLWGCGWPFRAKGYYRTTPLAERLGALCARVLPWTMSFATLIVARRRDST